MNEISDLYDVAVVGAGPAGATCAWKCAQAGLRVVLLERAANLPRYKPCGGGIPASLGRYVEGLDTELESFRDLTVTHLRHSWKGNVKSTVHAPMTTTSGEPAQIWMVQRPRFDQHLVDKARAAGAKLVAGVRVGEVETDADGATVRAMDGRVWRTGIVVGADGAKGVVGAQVGLRLRKQWGIAREAELPFAVDSPIAPWHPCLLPHTAYLDYGAVKNGYAWIFPKQGYLSVGAGMLVPKRPAARAEENIGQILRQAMDNLLHSVGLTYPVGADAPRLHAHPIPFWTGSEPLTTADHRALLVGDAAGVVQPLFGEGIQYAVRTGVLAAECIAGNTVPTYTERVRTCFADEFDAAVRVGRAFHRVPYLSYRLGVRNPRGTALVGRLMAGEASLAHLEQRIYERLRHPLRS